MRLQTGTENGQRGAVAIAAYLGAYVAFAGADAPLEPLGALLANPWNPVPAMSLALGYCLGWVALPAGLGAVALSGLIWQTSGAAEAVFAAFHTVLFAGAGLAMRGVGPREDLGRLRDVGRLVLAVAAAAALVALAGTAVFAAAETRSHDLVRAFFLLFFSNAVAGTAVLPLLMVACRTGWKHWAGRPSWETMLQVASLVLLSWEIFGQFANEEIRFFYLLFLPFAWIAARHGVPGSAAGLAATYGALIVSHWLLVHKETAIIELQVRMLALSVITLLVAAIASERRAAQNLLRARQAELAHVLRLNIGWEMASGLAHELNQPLTAAMSYNQAGVRLLRAAQGEPQCEKALSAFQKGLDQIEQAGHIIRRLREFMKKGDIQVAPVRVADIVRDAVGLAAAETSPTGIAVHVSLAPNLPDVIADKTQIVQVLLNLILNAAQAISGARASGGLIEIGARLVDDAVEISVLDDGPGIEPAVAQRLFEPFVTNKASGMGLGLSISRSIVESHGGRIWADPAPDRGALLKFTVPVAEESRAEHAA